MNTTFKYFTTGAAVWGAMLLASATVLSGQDTQYKRFDFALIGDVPYAPTGTAGTAKVQTYPSREYNDLIADINAHNKVLFTVHMGDIKAGDSWCVGGNARDAAAPGAADIYTTNLALFNTFRKGLIYLPGDNEWTDCHRTNNGAYNPTERLAYLRTVFFTANQSLGQKTIGLTRQAGYPENVTWRTRGILFVGLNQPGSNNNHQRNVAASNPVPTDANETEWTARDAANVAWITAAFDTATADATIRAIVFMQQANVFERYLEPNQGYTRSGYENFVKTLRNRTVAWGKPVFLVGGDTHTVRIDKPLTVATNGGGVNFHDPDGNLIGYPGHTDATGSGTVATTTLFSTTTGDICTTASTTCVAPVRVQNFTRVEVFGSPDVAWIRATADAADPNVLSFSMQTIAAPARSR